MWIPRRDLCMTVPMPARARVEGSEEAARLLAWFVDEWKKELQHLVFAESDLQRTKRWLAFRDAMYSKSHRPDDATIERMFVYAPDGSGTWLVSEDTYALAFRALLAALDPLQAASDAAASDAAPADAAMQDLCRVARDAVGSRRLSTDRFVKLVGVGWQSWCMAMLSDA